MLTTRISPMPMFEGDDMTWLDELRDEERIATSVRFVVRLTALAASGRITADEHRELYGWYGGGISLHGTHGSP